MKNWRVVRVTPKYALYVMETGYWTKKGAQQAANHLNGTFGAIQAFENVMLGHNFFVAPVSKIPALEKALELAREK